MREFWHNFTTSRNWFLGTIIAGFLIYLFLYRAVDPAGFTQSVNGFFRLIGQTIQIIFCIALALTGIRVVLGYRPWWLGGGGKKK